MLVTVPRSLLEEIGIFQGVQQFRSAHAPLLNPANVVILPRNLAEDDPTYKQLIVYFTIQQGSKILTYWRSPKGGDPRLMRKMSLGFGGHMNEDDLSPLAAIARELKEEIDTSVESVVFRGLINDDSDPVGKVHLGLYFDVRVAAGHVVSEDAHIERPEFLTHSAVGLQYEKLESWSKHVFDCLHGEN